jgi:predicted phosphodiesterase
MRIAILSDIHSNYEAFSAVAADVASQDVDGICILGAISSDMAPTRRRS